MADRDADVGGGIIAGALAYRLFIWLLPFALVLVAGLGLRRRRGRPLGRERRGRARAGRARFGLDRGRGAEPQPLVRAPDRRADPALGDPERPACADHRPPAGLGRGSRGGAQGHPGGDAATVRPDPRLHRRDDLRQLGARAKRGDRRPFDAPGRAALRGPLAPGLAPPAPPRRATLRATPRRGRLRGRGRVAPHRGGVPARALPGLEAGHLRCARGRGRAPLRALPLLAPDRGGRGGRRDALGAANARAHPKPRNSRSYTRKRAHLSQLRRGKPGTVSALRLLRHGAPEGGRAAAGDPQDRHDRLLRPQGVDGPRRAARLGVPAGADEPLLRGDAGRPRAARRHGREVHRRRDHGRLRPPARPRGRRAPRRAGGRRDAAHARRPERGARARMGREPRHPDRREHRRGGDRGRPASTS